MRQFITSVAILLGMLAVLLTVAPKQRQPIFHVDDVVYLRADGMKTMPLHVIAVDYPAIEVTWVSNSKTETKVLFAADLTK